MAMRSKLAVMLGLMFATCVWAEPPELWTKERADIAAFVSARADKFAKAQLEVSAGRPVTNDLINEVARARVELLAVTRDEKDPTATPSLAFRNAMTQEVVAQLFKFAASKDSGVAMNALMVLTDAEPADEADKIGEFLDVTKTPSVGVRYWSAKCLAKMLPRLKQNPMRAQRVLGAVNQALNATKSETSGLVIGEMVGMLLNSDNSGAVLNGVNYLKLRSGKLANARPLDRDLEAISASLSAINKALAGGLKLEGANLDAALTGAAQAASFVVQHHVQLAYPAEQLTNAQGILDEATTLIGTLLGQPVAKFVISADATKSMELGFKVDDLVGSPSAPGQIQKKFKVDAPPRIRKAG